MKNNYFRVCSAVAVLVFGASSVSEAGPVTFIFEATVDFVSLGASFDPELSLALNDVITGQFTFDPNFCVAIVFHSSNFTLRLLRFSQQRL